MGDDLAAFRHPAGQRKDEPAQRIDRLLLPGRAKPGLGREPLDLPAIAGIWRYGSVVRSWLLELLVAAYEKDPRLASVRGYVEDSGEGRWTVQAAIDENVPAPITTLALFSRFASRQEESYAAKVVAALRQEFGGHAVKPEEAG